MSLLIKGAEMPDSCLNCRFKTTMLKKVLSPTGMTSVYACSIRGMEINIWLEEKHKDCPLVKIPTPHGRLIDADRFLDWLKEFHPNDVTIMSGVKNARTVIEAEVSE